MTERCEPQWLEELPECFETYGGVGTALSAAQGVDAGAEDPKKTPQGRFACVIDPKMSNEYSASSREN